MFDTSRIIKNTPIPFLYRFTAPLKYIFHASSSMFNISLFVKSSLPPSYSTGFSAQKSDMTLSLIVFPAAYFKSNSANRISHLDNLPIKAGFSKKYFRGSILATIHTWKGRITCLNFYMAHTRAKKDFSIGVYLFS